jgi:hypothetical protein
MTTPVSLPSRGVPPTSSAAFVDFCSKLVPKLHATFDSTEDLSTAVENDSIHFLDLLKDNTSIRNFMMELPVDHSPAPTYEFVLEFYFGSYQGYKLSSTIFDTKARNASIFFRKKNKKKTWFYC